MLGLTQREIQDLTVLGEKTPIAAKVLSILQTIHADPSARLYAALAHVIENICTELYELKSTSIVGSSPKEDKIFERINMLITKLPDYQKASKSGKDSLKDLGLASKEELEARVDGSWVEKQAAKHKQKG